MWVRIPSSVLKVNKQKEKYVSTEKKNTWEMSYDEIFADWSSRYSFGSKGELTLQEAQEFHNKWKKLGIEAKKGF